jgi:hypothetical protein
MLKILLLSLTTASFAQPRWCGKVYTDRNDKMSAPMDKPLPLDIIPPRKTSFHAQTRKTAYAMHEMASLLVQITQFDSLENHVWMTCHVQQDEDNIVASSEIATRSKSPIQVDMTLLHPPSSDEQKWTYLVECDFTKQPKSKKLLATTLLQVTILANPKVVIDRKHASLIANGKIIYPFGGMSSYDWMIADPERVLREEFIPRGINTLHIVPGGPVVDATPWKKIFAAAHKLNVWVTYNMRHSYRNLTQLRLEVELFKDEPALLNWYTADEPDGWVEDVQDVKAAYDLILSLDGTHPVSLVLNCHRFRIADYARLADIVYTDPYPIGAKWCDERVNASFGCCGCDECGLWKPEPGAGVLDVAKRFDNYRHIFSRHAQPGPNDPHFHPLFGCLQAFGGAEWWERVPTNEELRIMFYLAIIHGATGMSWWVSPGPEATEVMLGVLGLEFAKFARHTLSMQRLTSDKVSCSNVHVHVAAWQGSSDEDVLLVVGNAGVAGAYHVHFTSPIHDKVQVVVGKLGHASVKHGVFEDSLAMFETKVLVFSPSSRTYLPSILVQPSS